MFRPQKLRPWPASVFLAIQRPSATTDYNIMAFPPRALHDLPCRVWHITTCRRMRKEKWSELAPNPCRVQDCVYCTLRHFVDHPIELISLYEEITTEMEEAIHHMYGHYTSVQWMTVFVYTTPSVPLLRLLFRKGYLSPDNSDPTTFLSRSVVWWRQEHIDFLLGPEIGMNINLQTPLGNSPLLQHVCTAYDDEENEFPYDPVVKRERLLRDLQRTAFLLERGGDPLLENKNGLSALSYVEGLTTFAADEKEMILDLLRLYV